MSFDKVFSILRGKPKPKEVKPSLPLSDRATSSLWTDVLLGALRVSDEKLNATATELFRRLGGPTISTLVQEAVNRKNSAGYRVRVLRTLKQMDPNLTSADFMDLTLLLRDKNTQVREAAGELISSLPERRGDLAAENMIGEHVGSSN